ncbi:MAG: SIR2 family protein [Candidatus Latescibacterota bacterium]|jgi:hypothetical protein
MDNVYVAAAQREKFLHRLTRRGRPSQGYRNLAALLHCGVFDTVFTTNFDQMVRKASTGYGDDIVEVNSLDQYRELEPAPPDPRVVRIHGDYWHGNLLNTEGEREDVPTIRFDSARRLLHSYGLVVVGYGGNDEGVMQHVFRSVLKEAGALKNGLFWCQMSGCPLSPRVRSLLEADTQRCFLLEIAGFDQLMAAIADRCCVEEPDRVQFIDEVRRNRSWRALINRTYEACGAGGAKERSDLFARLVELVGAHSGLLVAGPPSNYRVVLACNAGDVSGQRVGADLAEGPWSGNCTWIQPDDMPKHPLLAGLAGAGTGAAIVRARSTSGGCALSVFGGVGSLEDSPDCDLVRLATAMLAGYTDQGPRPRKRPTPQGTARRPGTKPVGRRPRRSSASR